MDIFKNLKDKVIGLLNILESDEVKKSIPSENNKVEKLNYQQDEITKIFFKNITESLPQYVFWKDVNSVYLGCNNNYAKLLGLNSPKDIIGKTDYDLPWQSAGDTTKKFQEGDRETLAGKPLINQKEILVLPDGKSLITLVNKLPIINNETWVCS